jgi:hypothetical protein
MLTYGTPSVRSTICSAISLGNALPPVVEPPAVLVLARNRKDQSDSRSYQKEGKHTTAGSSAARSLVSSVHRRTRRAGFLHGRDAHDKSQSRWPLSMPVVLLSH